MLLIYEVVTPAPR